MDNTIRLTSTEDRANSAFFAVMESAPMGLLVSAALGLAIAGVFQFLFYFQVIPSDWPATLRSVLSLSLAIFFEGLGFYFLVTTVRDFSGGARKEGWIGLAATFMLWGYAIWEGTHIASAFDGNTPESYWSIFGILGTIICVVRVVELRITLTVTSAVKRKQALSQAETVAATQEETIYRLQSELNVYLQEKNELEACRIQAENEAREQAEILRVIQAEKDAAELESLRRKVANSEKKQAAEMSGTAKVSRVVIERKTLEFMKRNAGMKPSQEIIAQLVGATTRSIRNHFPNGSWEAFLLQLQPEKDLSHQSHN